MSVLVINGIPLDIKRESLASTPEMVGEGGRAASGAWRNHRRYTKQAWDFSLSHMPQLEARAWAAMLRGDHHVWNFNTSLYSSKGQKPTAGYTATVGVTGKYGAGYLSVPAASSISWALGVGGGTGGSPLAWSVGVWRKESSVYHHYWVNSSGQKWLDGVRADGTTTTFLTVSSAGVVTLTGAASLTDFDELIVFPVEVPTTWPPLLYAFNSSYALPLSPRLEAYGDLIPGSTITTPLYVQGQADSFAHNPAKFSGTLDRVAATLKATLREE